MHQMPSSGAALNQLALSATLHCLTGCAIGEVLGMVIGQALGFSEWGTVALAVQTPFLNSFADLSSDLRPGVQAVRAALPTLNDALEVGAPVLRDVPPVNAELARTFISLRRLVDVPQTKTTLLRLRETFDQAGPLANWVVPFQTLAIS